MENKIIELERPNSVCRKESSIEPRGKSENVSTYFQSELPILSLIFTNKYPVLIHNITTVADIPIIAPNGLIPSILLTLAAAAHI